MSAQNLTVVIGAFFAIEAVAALLWPSNDKTMLPQSARIARLFAAICLITGAELIWN